MPHSASACFRKIRKITKKIEMDTAYTKEEIEAFFRNKLHDIYGDEFRLRIDWLDVIPPDPNGKLRCFVCQLPVKGGK